jgi:hypothetical protein
MFMSRIKPQLRPRTKIEMVTGYPLRIPAIPWRISASANGYPPEGADAPFPLNSWQISGYPKGYLPIQEALGGPQAVRNKIKKGNIKEKNGALTKKHGFCCAHCTADTFFN